MNHSPRLTQSGFTLPEMLAVIALIGILATTIIASFGSAETELAMASSKDSLINDVPAALLSYRSINGSLSGLDASDLTKAGVPSKGPFGDDWELENPVGHTVQLKWNLESGPEDGEFGANLATSLSNLNGSAISSAEASEDGAMVTVSYRIP